MHKTCFFNGQSVIQCECSASAIPILVPKGHMVWNSIWYLLPYPSTVAFSNAWFSEEFHLGVPEKLCNQNREKSTLPQPKIPPLLIQILNTPHTSAFLVSMVLCVHREPQSTLLWLGRHCPNILDLMIIFIFCIHRTIRCRPHILLIRAHAIHWMCASVFYYRGNSVGNPHISDLLDIHACNPRIILPSPCWVG